MSRDFRLQFYFMILNHLDPLFIWWSFFQCGFDYANYWACAKNSTVSLTLLSQTQTPCRCHWHRRARRCHGRWGVKLSGVNDKAELIVIGIIYFSTKIQEHKQYMLRFFMGNTVHIHMVYGRRRNCVSTRLFSISPPQHFYRQLLAFLAVAQQHHVILQVTATLWVSELKEEGD